MKKVSREDFNAFIAKYPKDLRYRSALMVDTWNDYTAGEWPKSTVAAIWHAEGLSYFIIDRAGTVSARKS